MNADWFSPRAIIASYREDIRRFDPNLRLLFTAIIFNSIGTGFILPFIVIYFNEVLSIKYSLIGIALGVRGVIDLVFKFAGGNLADRIGRKRVLITGIIFFLLSYIAFVSISTFKGLLVAVTIQGIGLGLFWPASLSMISDLVSPEMKQKAFAINRAARTGGLGLGIALGGFIATFSYRALFYLDIFFTALFLLVVIFRIPETRSKDGEEDQDGGRLRKAIRDPRIVIFALLNISFALLVAQFINIFPPYLKDFLGVSNLLIGNVFLINAVIIVIFQLNVVEAVEQVDAMQTFRYGFLLWLGATSLIFIATPGFIAIIVSALAIILISFASMVFNPSAASFVSRIAPDGSTGTYMSMYSASYSIGFLLGPVMGGWFLDNHPRELWLALTALVLFSLTALQLYRKHILDY
ncbi:MAG: MFS transporter [Candidatus Nanohaloarchaea archaeon]|nr:MFS transporter [Candidatus Nanohaloarchaea archaeon]